MGPPGGTNSACRGKSRSNSDSTRAQTAGDYAESTRRHPLLGRTLAYRSKRGVVGLSASWRLNGGPDLQLLTRLTVAILPPTRPSFPLQEALPTPRGRGREIVITRSGNSRCD